MTAGDARRKVLVLGRGERAFLATVRSFGRRGLTVHVGWVPADDLAMASRYVRAVHDIPPYAPDDTAWLEALLRLCREQRFDLVVPTTDASVVPLQRHRAALEPHVRVYLLPDPAFTIAFDKARTYDLATSLGVPVPPQQRLRLPVRAGDIDPSCFPVVLKPLSSFDPRHGGTLKLKSRVVERPEDLPPVAATFAGQAEVLVQQCVDGIGTGIEILALEGRVLAAFQHLRVHTRRTDGADSYRGSVPVHPAMYEAVVHMVRALGYGGVAMFEFVWDQVTGRWTFLEINGRFWGSLPLSLQTGADFPYWLYEMLVEGRCEFPSAYRTGVYCRNWTRDLVWLRERAAGRSWRRLVTQLLGEMGPLLWGREGSDTLVLDDPAPGIAEIWRLVGRALGAPVSRDGH